MKKVVAFSDRNSLAAEAAEWLIRLDSDEPPDAKVLDDLQQWMQRSPAHRAKLEDLARLWERVNVLTELAVPLGRSANTARADRRGAGAPRDRFAKQVTRFGIVGLVLIVGTIALLHRFQIQTPIASSNGLYATAVGQQSSTMLADGSEIVLNTNSQIRVAYSDDYRRIHLLQGEVLFTVAKDAGRPFRVYAGSGRIQALGTAFSVYLNSEGVDVTVAEGRVSLASIDRSRPAIPDRTEARAKAQVRTSALEDEYLHTIGTVEAGQVATLPGSAAAAEAAEGGIADLEIIKPIAPEELAQRLAWRDGVLMFAGNTLEEVVREVSRYTTVNIEVPDAEVRRMRIGGRLQVGETGAMLAALETNFSLEVTRLGRDRVILTASNK